MNNTITFAEKTSSENLAAGQFWYNHVDEELYILSEIDDRFVLVSLSDGGHWTALVDSPQAAFDRQRFDFTLITSPFTIAPDTNTMNTPIIKEAIAWFESLPPDPQLSPEATSLALAVALHIVRQQTLRTKDWIKHDGGERPVPGSTRIRVRYSDGGEDTGPADDWSVSWTNAITHYKILDTNN